MSIAFDIGEDELQIFLAETEEHLQQLDEGLLRLEREGDSPALIQEVFRSAHTLKGSAGMIGHRRMAELTHAMETIFDGLRKKTIAVSTPLVDACLEALDGLKLLRDEAATGVMTALDVDPYKKRLSGLINTQNATTGPKDDGRRENVPPKADVGRRNGKAAPGSRGADGSKRNGRGKNGRRARAQKSKSTAMSRPAGRASRPVVRVSADIAPDSAGSAARAFQILLALQSLGEVRHLAPSQSVIETAAPVRQVTADLMTDQPGEQIRRALLDIADVERVVLDGEEFRASLASPPAETAPESGEAPKIGEFLVRNGYISAAQLDAAMRQQAAEPPPPKLLGQVLVSAGALSQEALDKAVARHLQDLRAALHEAHPQKVERAKGRGGDKTIRTSIERLDSLMNLVGELITDRNRLYQIRAGLESHFRNDDEVESFTQTILHVGRITDQLQEEVMRIRTLPIANVFGKFPRLVRDLAHKAGKSAELVIRGEETELDRSVIEAIGDPLIHLLRNAVDHGIEPPGVRLANGKPEHGIILLAARQEENHAIVTVEDDGQGIDAARVTATAVQRGLLTQAEAACLSPEESIELIFQSGLSTAGVVTDVSGRGVGMDIVRANIEGLNGSVAVETWPGRGTRFQITLPLTLAIVPSLLVGAGDGTFAIPLATVTETLRIPKEEIRSIQGRLAIQLRGRVLPLVSLSRVLEIKGEERVKRNTYVVAVRWGKMEMGLMVDRLVGKQEMVIKPLGDLAHETLGMSGAAILGDGRIALILDMRALFKLAGAS